MKDDDTKGRNGRARRVVASWKLVVLLLFVTWVVMAWLIYSNVDAMRL